MKIFQWFKTMTFEGKIKKEISSISAENGKLEVQLLDKKINGEDAYRINLTRTSIASFQSLPIVLSSSQIKELTNSIFQELEHNDTSSNKAFVIVPTALGRFRAPQYWRYRVLCVNS